MSYFTTIWNKIKYEVDKVCWRRNEHAVDAFFSAKKVRSIDETIEKLLNSQCSMCRYGDREFRTMCGKGINGKKDYLLGKRLKAILRTNENEDIIICIPNVKEDMTIRTPQARAYWEMLIRQDGRDWVSLLNHRGTYYNAHVSRLYFDYQNQQQSDSWFRKMKLLWDQKDILFVEGEKTRLGINNTLFDNAKSIKRILAPAQNAFGFYDQILASVLDHWNGELVFIALGPTATVLAYDLFCKGIRALDIGNIDIEYMWFLNGATEKTALPGKIVEEVKTEQTEIEKTDEEYLSQIIAKVGV